ncbi:MAG: DUF6132 family protein [Ferruginibacter sp.]
MKKWFKSNLLYIIGAVIGALGGYLYWNFVGCSSGTCAITSKPVNSTLYGALMGSLLFGIFKKEKKSSTTTEKNNDHDI